MFKMLSFRLAFRWAMAKAKASGAVSASDYRTMLEVLRNPVWKCHGARVNILEETAYRFVAPRMVEDGTANADSGVGFDLITLLEWIMEHADEIIAFILMIIELFTRKEE